MNHPPQSVYQQVIERTKGGFFRTQVISYVSQKTNYIYNPMLTYLLIVLRFQNLEKLVGFFFSVFVFSIH